MTARILVAGVGNVLLQDDGFGPHAIARLEAEYEIGSDVELLDLGTPGLDFVDYLVGRDVLIILDALSSGGEPGEILTFDHQRLREYLPNVRLSAHQPCLQETLFTAETAGVCPPDVLLIGVVGSCFDVNPELSPRMSAVMPQASGADRQRFAPAWCGDSSTRRPAPVALLVASSRRSIALIL